MIATLGVVPGEQIIVDTDGPAYRHALAYLIANGAPPSFSFEEQRFAYPGGPALAAGTFAEQFIVWSKIGFPSLYRNAVLTYIRPDAALADLMAHFQFGNPLATPPSFTPYAPPPPPPPPPAQIEDPVGKPIAGMANAYETVGGMFLYRSGDRFTRTSTGEQFVVHVARTPFGGGSAYWEMVS